MFKKLREKVAEEIQQAKVNIQGQASQYYDNYVNNDKRIISTDIDMSQQSISNSDSHQNLMQFSLVDLDDNEESNTNTNTKTESESMCTTTSTSSLTAINNFVPQSEIESEYESESNSHSISPSLDNVTKEQLLDLCIKLKERGRKYRDRWTQVINGYRALNDEKDYMKKVLEHSQDKALRRINELKEQCHLEQLAKRHLEENLQVVIEEKDEKIKVLQTKIGLLNDDKINFESNDLLHFSSEHRENEKTDETGNLQEKVERLELLLTRCKESLKSNKDKLNYLNKENEQLVIYKTKCDVLCEQIETHINERDSTNLSYAEAKQQLHNELESKNIIIADLKEQIDRLNAKLRTLESDLDAKSKSLYDIQQKIIQIEKTTEEDKENLIQELSRVKAAAIHLIRDEFEKKMIANDQQWTNRYDDLIKQNNDLNKSYKQIDETRIQNENLKVEINECHSQLNKVEQQLNQAEQSRLAEKTHLEQLLRDSEQKSSQLSFEIGLLKQNCAHLDNLKVELEKSTRLLVSAETKTDSARNELESMRLQLQEKDMLLSNVTLHENAINQINQQFNNQLILLETDLNERNLKIHVLEKDLNVRSEECINHLQQLKSIECDNYELVNQLKCTQSDFDELTRTNDSLISQLNQINAQLSETIDCFAIYKKSSEQSIDKLNESLELEKYENTRLNNEIKKMNDNSICFDSMKKLLNETQNSLQNVEHHYQQSLSQIEIIKNQLDCAKTESNNFKQQLSVNENLYQTQLNDQQINFDHSFENERKLTECLKLELETISNEKTELIEQLNDLKLSNIQLTDSNDLLKSQNNELRDSFQIESNKVEQLTLQIQYLDDKFSDYGSLNNRIELNEQSLKMSESKNEHYLKENLILNKQLEDNNILLIKLREQSNSMEENFKTKIEKMQTNFDDRSSRLSYLESQLNTLTENSDFYAKRAEKLLNDKSECDNIIAELSSDNEKLIEITNDFEKKVSTLQIDLNDQKSHYENIIETIKREENSRLNALLNIPRICELGTDINVHIPEPTEYQYLRNILFEFMMGREPVTLAKVISAVMRFSSDQTEQIIKRQETSANSM